MQRKELWLAMEANFQWDKKQYHDHSDYVRLKPKDIFLILNGVSGRFKPIATKLLRQLATNRWYVLSSVHEGGTAINAPLHITLRAPDGIHINCKKLEQGGLYAYEITERD